MAAAFGSLELSVSDLGGRRICPQKTRGNYSQLSPAVANPLQGTSLPGLENYLIWLNVASCCAFGPDFVWMRLGWF